MSSEELIEEILFEANSMGFRKELIERVSLINNNEDCRRLVDIYEEVFNKILIEITD
jgi:hypothetical protein